jgi:hypothetical protein
VGRLTRVGVYVGVALPLKLEGAISRKNSFLLLVGLGFFFQQCLEVERRLRLYISLRII